jgi:hypothetical protein
MNGQRAAMERAKFFSQHYNNCLQRFSVSETLARMPRTFRDRPGAEPISCDRARIWRATALAA